MILIHQYLTTLDVQSNPLENWNLLLYINVIYYKKYIK